MILVKPPTKIDKLYAVYELSQQNVTLHIEVVKIDKVICNTVMTLIHEHLLFTNVAYNNILAFAQYLNIMHNIIKVKLINNNVTVDLDVEPRVELYLSKQFN
jgi:hypothetical protein